MIPSTSDAPVRPRILIVDDEPGVRDVLRRVLRGAGYDLAEAENGRVALELLARDGADAILSDYSMPEMNGIELLRAARLLDDSVAFIVLTGAGTVGNAIEALRLQADDYLLKPFNIDEVEIALQRALQHRRLVLENRRYQLQLESRVEEQAERLERMFIDGLLTIANAVEARDRYTGGHVERVMVYAVATGCELGLTDEELRPLAVAGLLHDVGKIGIPDQLLTRAGPLNAEEFRVMQQHPSIGATILQRSAFLQEAIPGVLHHHERWDGTGYPSGLCGEAISLAGRILAVVDTFDAIITTRPYRGRRSSEEALKELARCADSQFDPRVVRAFSRTYRNDFGKSAELPWVHALQQRGNLSDVLRVSRVSVQQVA